MEYFGRELHVKAKKLFWENGTPYFYLADTQWFALTKRVNEKMFEKILLKRKSQGFTAIQLVLGIPPEIDIWDENAKSSGGNFVFNKDFTVNKQYFKDIESKIKLMVKYHLVPVIFGSWGNHIDIVGERAMKDLWTYIVKYFSKYPVIYSLCGEVDIFPANKNLEIGIFKKILYKIPYLRNIALSVFQLSFKVRLQNRLNLWQNVARHLKDINSENHPVTAHVNSQLLASEIFQDTSWLDIDSFQSGHSLQGINLMNSNFQKLKHGKKAYLNLEPLYEGILGQNDVRLQNYAFWKSIFSGSIGHAYGAHGMWQMSTNDNFLSHWGKSTWQEALEFTGAKSIGNAKKYLLQNKFEKLNLSENNLLVNIFYKSKPKLLHLCATTGKTIFIYIPYPNLIDDVKLPKYHSIKLINANTFQTVGITNDTAEFLLKLKRVPEIFLEVMRV